MPPGLERTHLLARPFPACPWVVEEIPRESWPVGRCQERGTPTRPGKCAPALGAKLVRPGVGVGRESVVGESLTRGLQPALPPPRAALGPLELSRPACDCNSGAMQTRGDVDGGAGQLWPHGIPQLQGPSPGFVAAKKRHPGAST